MWIGRAIRGDLIVQDTAWCEDPFAPSVIRYCSTFRLDASGYKIATPPLCWCCFPLRFGTPATARIDHQLSITSFGRNVPDRWYSVKMITFFMMGKLRIYFHFSSAKPLMLIVTHQKSTCVGAEVEVCEEDSELESEGCCFCFLLL